MVSDRWARPREQRIQDDAGQHGVDKPLLNSENKLLLAVAVASLKHTLTSWNSIQDQAELFCHADPPEPSPLPCRHPPPDASSLASSSRLPSLYSCGCGSQQGACFGRRLEITSVVCVYDTAPRSSPTPHLLIRVNATEIGLCMSSHFISHPHTHFMNLL